MQKVGNLESSCEMLHAGTLKLRLFPLESLVDLLFWKRKLQRCWREGRRCRAQMRDSCAKKPEDAWLETMART